MGYPGTVLITGATSGLGTAFARHLADQGYGLVLTGRNVDALAEISSTLEAEHDITVETLWADLLSESGLNSVVERLESPTRPITFLINNAGSGMSDEFHESALDDELAQLRLNVEIPMRLCHAALPLFLRRGGRILNVASIAGLVSDGTYGASKAWVINFSQWAHTCYAAQGVHVTALCPGLMRTDFHRRAGIDTKRRPGWAFTELEQVALEGIAACQQGRALHIPGRTTRNLVRAAKLAPASLVEKITRNRKNEQ